MRITLPGLCIGLLLVLLQAAVRAESGLAVIVPPGHVLVIDCRGETRVASGGQILTTRLMVRGAAGLVSDGPVRDSGPISRMDFPVYCAGGSAPLNLIHHHTIDLNVPIGCGGVAVYPGDVIVGDDEGVAVIPRHLADEVARDAV